MTLDVSNQFKDNWSKQLPVKVDELQTELEQLIKSFNSLQLIAYITHVNHLRNMSKAYSDVNEGRMAVIPELIALMLLRKPFKETCDIEHKDFLENANKVNDVAKSFLMMSDALKSSRLLPKAFGTETTLEQVTNKLKRDETWIRNPGFPAHHYEFVTELFKPLAGVIKQKFGFSLEDSIKIRNGYIPLINDKMEAAITRADEQGAKMRTEILTFRNTGHIPVDSTLSREQFHEFKGLPLKKLKEIFNYHFREKVYYSLHQVYAISAEELSEYLKLDLKAVSKFLDCFSCDFGASIGDDDLMGANLLLKTKPIIRHENTYTVPSISMLTWCVEQTIEEFIKTSSKLSNRYKDVKHDYLLQKGVDYFKKILPDAVFYPLNLYYGSGEHICETDGLIGFEDTLFVIEAKGHRLSNKAKGGNYQRTENHLSEMIGDAVAQGKRTIEYIKLEPIAVFKTKKGEAISIERDKYKKIITIGLTLEPIGNLTPLMKVSNDLNYFDGEQFPWIVSLYDLVVFADFIEMPILFLQYLKRRRRFLELQNTYVFEEIDLLGYFLSNGLYIEPTVRKAEAENISWLAFDNNTDDFNDYYMFKYGYTQRTVVKRKSFISDELRFLLTALQVSPIKERSKIMLELLNVDSSSMKKLTDYIKNVKRQFLADKEIHDCSIGTANYFGNIGITYMIGPDTDSVQSLLNGYCDKKFYQQHAKTWIGIGDIGSGVGAYNFKCSFIKERTVQ